MQFKMAVKRFTWTKQSQSALQSASKCKAVTAMIVIQMHDSTASFI